MSKTPISGGYILISRKLIESEIWKKPPLYVKIWIYLLTKAQHCQYKGLKRGELRTSIPEIIEECSWYVGYRKVKPTKDQIYNILEWLRKPYESNDESNNEDSMIATTKATQGLLVNIVNYNVYQDPKNYESNDEDATKATTKTLRKQRQADNINKNDKNDKNVKNKENNIIVLNPDEAQFIKTLESISNYPLDRQKDLEMYKKLKERYPQLDLLESIKDWATYKLDKPLKEKDNPRSQINTAFKKYVEWGKNIKRGVTDGNADGKNTKTIRFNKSKFLANGGNY